MPAKEDGTTQQKVSVWIDPKFAKLIGRDAPDDGWVEPAVQSWDARNEPPDLHIPALAGSDCLCATLLQRYPNLKRNLCVFRREG
jgi:hypothetical protein